MSKTYRDKIQFYVKANVLGIKGLAYLNDVRNQKLLENGREYLTENDLPENLRKKVKNKGGLKLIDYADNSGNNRKSNRKLKKRLRQIARKKINNTVFKEIKWMEMMD